jgi:hypothetical protein
VLGGEGQACLSRRRNRPPEGWIAWITSVIAASTLINVAGSVLPALFTGDIKPAAQNVAESESLLRALDHIQRAVTFFQHLLNPFSQSKPLSGASPSVRILAWAM